VTHSTAIRSTLALVAALLLSAPADALLFRAYLDPTGSDANPCTLPQPCRLLPAALAALADGGEIWMLDSANYNTAPVNITKSVTILAVPGALGSVVAAGGNAIEIATAGVEVALRNLVIVPLPGGGGTGGISMTNGAALTVENCLVANLPGTGIDVVAAASVRVTDSAIRDNGDNGMRLEGAHAPPSRGPRSAETPRLASVVFGTGANTTTADIASSTVDANSNGVYAYSSHASGALKVSVRDSQIVRNDAYGLVAHSVAGASVTFSASNNMISKSGISGLTALQIGSKVLASAKHGERQRDRP
jgi:hypothetical protein